MSTESAETGIDFLFAPENAAPSGGEANPQSSEQPAPPDVDPHQHLEANPQPQPPAQAPGQEQQAQQPPQQQQPHMVPLAELEKTRERARAAEEYQRNQQREIDQLKQQMVRLTQPPPQAQPQLDPVEDPDGFAQNLMQAVDQRFLNLALNESERRARSDHGSELVDAAFEAAQRSGWAPSFVNKPDAYGEMVRWYRNQQIAEQIGPDPDAYRQKLEQEIKAKLIAEMKQGTPPPSNLPPSLSGATNANPSANSAVLGSDQDFFNDMMNRKRG